MVKRKKKKKNYTVSAIKNALNYQRDFSDKKAKNVLMIKRDRENKSSTKKKKEETNQFYLTPKLKNKKSLSNRNKKFHELWKHRSDQNSYLIN